MKKRFVSVWFRYLKTDWFTIQSPELKDVPFVLRTPSHGRMVITAANAVAEAQGIFPGMVLADARAIMPDLVVMDDKPDLPSRLLKRIGEWCIRFSPHVSVDLPDGLIFDATGCTHLWNGDEGYLNDIGRRLKSRGYFVRMAIADTPGVAWGVARYGNDCTVVEEGKNLEALIPLPPEALRLEDETVNRLHQLGLKKVSQFIQMPRSSLRRRFGIECISRIDQVLGSAPDISEPIQPPEPYQERLPCLEPIVTLPGIEIALRELLQLLCARLRKEQKGLRSANFKGYRVDGKVVQVCIVTNAPSHDVNHLFKLFGLKLSAIEPALGIELFIMEAPTVEDLIPQQEKMWKESVGLDDVKLAELLDRLANKIGAEAIHRYLPDQHYWPERSFRESKTLQEQCGIPWRTDKQRPLHLLGRPEKIEVTAPIPDYPPMLFRHKGKVHKIIRADGPERIEQEWWIQQGQHRDYYLVEDDSGSRYWLFRLGHYEDATYQWYLHGYFA